MIYFNKEQRDIHLQNLSSSYILRILDEGHISVLYYGDRLENRSNFNSLYKRYIVSRGVSYEWGKEYSMVGEAYDFSYYDKGDYREASIDLLYSDGSKTCDFNYHSHKITGEKLEIQLVDSVKGLWVNLIYIVGEYSITRCTELENKGEELRINRLAWATFDTFVQPLKVMGSELQKGIRFIESRDGELILENDDLTYSFKSETVKPVTARFEKSPLDITRVIIGDNEPFTLSSGEKFKTPEIHFSYEKRETERGISPEASIVLSDDIFYLRTNNLSYCFNTDLEHLYFGESWKESTLEPIGFEFDADELLHIEGVEQLNFSYSAYRIEDGKEELKTLPSSHSCDKSLVVVLQDKALNLEVELIYGLFFDSDCFTRNIRVINKKQDTRIITKALSMQLPFQKLGYNMMTLDGDWISERHINMRPLDRGVTYIDSKKGSSSNYHNPFIAISREGTDEFHGNCAGFALLYSGNHLMQGRVADSTIISCGINPHFFAYHMEDLFETPELVFTYSETGYNTMSQNLHSFVNNNIVPAQFKEKERPVLINSWEATYFNFNERKLLNLAEKAKKLGVELFVLDDGWFGKRNNDKSSLGDFSINRKKLKNGLKGLCTKLNKKGLDFGLWVEPEMISIDSDLYRAHPEYLIKHPDREMSFGRNQGILDFANPEVVDHVYKELENVFSSCNLKYVKWDMNRNFSDTYSSYLKDQRECTHRYMLGVYDLFKRIMKRFPHILFEGCAAGGDRFDMGILCYFPQIWTSDNTDATERTYIQYGTSMAYPQSVMCAQLTADVNHQILRQNPIETRFNIATFGSFGLSVDLSNISRFNKRIIKEQIAFYKKHRSLLQFGKLTRMESPYEGNNLAWMVSNEDSSENFYLNYQELIKPSRTLDVFKLKGLNEEYNYTINNRPQVINVKVVGELLNHVLPFKIKQNGFIHNIIDGFYRFETEEENIKASGTELNCFGFFPKQQFDSSDVNEHVRLLTDFSSRLYHIKKD